MADPEFHRQALEHLDALYRLAVHLVRNHPDAEDLVQETYLRAFRFANRFEPGTHLKAWLFQILRNTFLTFYRLRQREPAMSEDGVSGWGAAPMFQHAPQADGRSTGARVDLERALAALPEEFRTILFLAEVQGVPLEEVAEIMDCPVGTVKSRLFRAKERLRAVLPDYRDELKG
ncbi:MAG: sigma-70 family RNA polymerase sigma factor [candidate division NC10 bacterium]